MNQSCCINVSCCTHDGDVWMNHVAHVTEYCCTYGWVILHIWMSRATHRNESCRTYKWVVLPTWMSQVAHMNESYRTYEWIILRIWMRRVPHSRSPAQQRRRHALSQIATLCNTLQHTATHCNTDYRHSKGGAQENDAAEHPRRKPSHVSLCCTVLHCMLKCVAFKTTTQNNIAAASLLGCIAFAVCCAVCCTACCTTWCGALQWNVWGAAACSATCQALQARPIFCLKNLCMLWKEPYVFNQKCCVRNDLLLWGGYD